MQVIAREELIRRIGSSEKIALVEVLDPEYYAEFHLPGAINVPLSDHFDQAIRAAVPDRHTPVIVYCRNERCTASTEAAKRLDDLGYLHVYDYTAGKTDWKEAGLPVETGTAAAST